jgi:hypothetical protein
MLVKITLCWVPYCSFKRRITSARSLTVAWMFHYPSLGLCVKMGYKNLMEYVRFNGSFDFHLQLWMEVGLFWDNDHAWIKRYVCTVCCTVCCTWYLLFLIRKLDLAQGYVKVTCVWLGLYFCIVLLVTSK